jgi:hypothetical protein
VADRRVGGDARQLGHAPTRLPPHAAPSGPRVIAPPTVGRSPWSRLAIPPHGAPSGGCPVREGPVEPGGGVRAAAGGLGGWLGLGDQLPPAPGAGVGQVVQLLTVLVTG